jgi:ABC-type transporter Mla subunit MlaD
MNDRRIGYVVLGLLGSLLVAFTSYFTWLSLFPADRRTILFPDVGNLKIDDALTVYGMQLGSIDAIQWQGPDRVVVSVRSSQKLAIFADYRITGVDKGFMGDRYIMIEPGSPAKQRMLGSDTLRGSFVAGISEGVDHVAEFKACVESLRVAVDRIYLGSETMDPFPQEFGAFMAKVDTFTTSLDVNVAGFDHDLGPQIDTLNSALRDLSEFSHTLGTELPRYSADIARFITKADTLLGQVDNLLAGADSLLRRLEYMNNGPSRDTMKKLRTQVAALRKTTDDLRTKGLPLPVKIVGRVKSPRNHRP